MRAIKLKINEREQEFLIEEHQMLSELLRNQAGLTGTKIGCEQGTCGTCTVLVDGEAVVSCLTPAAKCEGKAVTTIEGLSHQGMLHRLQQKLVEKGAIQCGFCTPGMVMTALDFVRHTPHPSIEEIKMALSGNLCRCTGYKKILEAVAEYASEGNVDSIQEATPKSTSRIGVPRPYIDAEKKVKGEAEYADDIYVRNSLHCKILRSTHAHAKLLQIDTREAEKIKGVHAILLGRELPVKFGVLPISQDETALAIDKVRYIGEPVAAVAADTEAIATRALSQIKVTYDPLQAYLTIDDSLSDVGEQEKIHDHVRYNNNVHKKAELRFGNQKQGLDASDVVSSLEFEFEGVSHAFTEPHAATAYWDENGLTVITSTQIPHYVHRALARVLEVPLSRVRVIKPYVGGGFGGKSDPFPHEMIIAQLSRKTGRPVKIRLTREEVFINNHGRHPSRMKIDMGINRDGMMQVLDADIAIDGGAYGSFGVVTSYYNGVLLQAPYKIDNFGFRTFRLYTNKPQCGAMRGHGAVNSRFAIESVIDDLARKIDMDPCMLRLKNFIGPDTFTVGQYRITSNGSKECLETVMQASDWDNRFAQLPYGHGLGVACGFFISGSALPIIRNELPQSVVHLKLDFDGRVIIYSGASDIGQGSDTMLALIVAEVLGIDLDRIAVCAGDTMLTPVDLGSYSSRVTFMAGNAAKMAAENLRNALLIAVSGKYQCAVDTLSLSDGQITSDDRSISLQWMEVVDIATAQRGAFTVHGMYISPKMGGDFKGAGAGLSPSYSFGACVAEVKVDLDTGAVKLLNIWGAHDCGKALNPLAVEGQLEGSWHMGIGQALSEELKYYNGLIVNNNFLDYEIPTSMDTPAMHTHIVESNDPEGPFGAKECGEGALHPVIPAIANAIFDAVGVRVIRLPIAQEDILEKIHASKALEVV